MAETIADNATIDSEETSAPEENPVVATNEAPAPKKRGRPIGAKDRAPRVKKAIVIVEEPLQVPEPEKPEKPEKKPRVKKARPPTPSESESEEVPTPPVAPDPPSPRDLYKEASRLIFTLQHTKNDARRSRLQDQYTKGLLAL